MADAFVVTGYTLYQPESVLGERVGSAGVLAAYLKELQGATSEVIGSAPRAEGASGSLVIAVKPGNTSRFWLVGVTALSPEVRAKLMKALEAVHPLDVRGGPIAVAMNFNAWGGSPPSASQQSPPIPDEWEKAIKGAKAPMALPDGVLQVVWP
jgi:hypothetical protein